MEINLIAFVIETVGLIIASAILKVNLTFKTAPIVILVGTLSFHILPGGFVLLTPLIYCFMIKIFDKDCDFLQLVGLLFIGLAVQQGIMKLWIEPILLHKLLSA